MRCQDCRTALTDVRVPCPGCGRRVVPVQTIGLSGTAPVQLLAYGMAMMLLGVVIVMSIGPEVGETIWIGTFWIGPILIGTAVFCGTLVVHELVHGFAMRWFGAQPRYGVGLAAWFLPYAYATAPGHPFTLAQFTVIALAPLLVISAGSLLLMWTAPAVFGYAAVAFVGNFSGAVGDLWFVAAMMRFRRCADLRLVDVAENLAVYTTDPSASIIARHIEPSKRAAWLVQFGLWWVGIASALFTASPFVMGALNSWGVKDVAIGLPGYPFLGTTPSGFFIDIVPLLVTSFLLAVPATMASRRYSARTRRRPTVVDGPRSGAPRPALL